MTTKRPKTKRQAATRFPMKGTCTWRPILLYRTWSRSAARRNTIPEAVSLRCSRPVWPLPFELEYAAAIADDPARVERALHKAFTPQRLHPRREFFKVEPYQVIAILRLLNVADVTEQAKSDVEAEKSQEDREALARARRPVLNFADLGLPEGSILTYLRDERVKAEIVDGRRVRLIELPENKYPAVVLDGEPSFLSPLSRDLLGVARYVGPTRYWRVEDGRSLLEIYDEKHGPRE